MSLRDKIIAALRDDDLRHHGLTLDDLGPADEQGRLRNANTVIEEKRREREAEARAEQKRGR